MPWKNRYILGLILLLTGAAIGAGWWQFGSSTYRGEPQQPQQTLLPQNVTPLSSETYQKVSQLPKQSVVKLPDEAARAAFLKANQLSAADLQTVPELSNTYIVNEAPDKLVAAGAQVSQQQYYVALLTPNDPIYPQWYSDKISAPAAWDISTGSAGVTVADIDTGFALNHEDLAGRFAAGGKDFVHNDSDPSTGTSNPSGAGVAHGTATAGLIGATGNNGKGVAAINWGVKILPIQVLDDNGVGTTTTVAAGIHYAVTQGVRVINLSLGIATADPILKAELDFAQSQDVVVVAASGNCGSPASYSLNGCSYVGQMVYPANYPQVLAVGATDSGDSRATFSSYGANLDVVAPGSGSLRTPVWSASNQTNLYSSNLNGTSFASPIVAGLVALYRGLNPGATLSQTINAITASTDKPAGMGGQAFSNEYGFGRINANATLRSSGAAPSVTPPADNNPISATPTPPAAQPAPSPIGTPLPHPDGTLIFNPNGPGVVIVQDGKLAPIISGAIMSSYNFSWSSVKNPVAGDNQLATTTALPFREGTLLESQGRVYAVDITPSGVQQKRWINSWDAFVQLGYSLNDILYVSLDILPAQDGPDLNINGQHPDGALIYTPDHSGILLIQNGQRRPVIYAEIFRSYGYDWSKVKNPTAADNALPPGPNLDTFQEGTLINADGHIYVIDITSAGVQQKRGIASWDAFVAFGYSPSEALIVPSFEVPASDGSPLALSKA